MSAKRGMFNPERPTNEKSFARQKASTNGQTPVTELPHFFRESDSFFGEFSPKHYVIAVRSNGGRGWRRSCTKKAVAQNRDGLASSMEVGI